LSLIQNLLPSKKPFFSNLDSANFEKNWEKTFLRKHYVLVQNLLLFKKVFSIKLFFNLDSAVISEKNWEKLFFENTMFLFRICCSSKNVFFQ
jgi:hypothetical protein